MPPYARMPLCCDFERKGGQAAKNSNRRHTWLLGMYLGCFSHQPPLEDSRPSKKSSIFLVFSLIFVCHGAI